MSSKKKGEKVQGKGGFEKVQDFFAKPGPKKVIAVSYSLGAAVVIVGALFKIMHFPGAGPVLTIGMITEAVLFLIGILEKPHPEYHWQNVYPELLHEHGDSSESASNGVSEKSSATSHSVASASNGLSLDATEMDKLSVGINSFAQTAEQFAQLSSLVAPTNKFVEKINGATEAAEQFTAAQEGLNSATQGMGAVYTTITKDVELVQKQTQDYSANLGQINSQLSSINSVYELQLKNIKMQTEQFGMQSEKIASVSKHIDVVCEETNKMQQDVILAAKESDKYKTAVTKLSEQVADLNKVYGNMLNALN